MIIRNKKEEEHNQDDSVWDKFELKVRLWAYTLMHEVTRRQIFSTLLYMILIAIETCQFVWYALHIRLNYLWTSQIFYWIQTIIKFSQVDAFLTTNGSGLLIPLLYITTGLLVVMLIIGIINGVIINRQSHRLNSSFMNYSMKTLNAYNFLLSTILAFPFFFTLIAVLACSDNNPMSQGLTCYRGTFFVHFIVAILDLIVLVGTTLLLTFLSVDLNPWSKSPFAAPKSPITLLKLILKVAVSLYFVLDYKGKLVKGFIVVYLIAWVAILFMRYRQTPPYNRTLFNFVLAMESIILWVTLVSLFEAFIDSTPPNNIGILFLGLGMPPVIFVVIMIFKMRRESFFKIYPKAITRDIDAELYILNAIELIEKRVKDEAPQVMWYKWLKGIVTDCLDRFPKSARLHILYSYMAKEKLENVYRAIFELMEAQNHKPSIEEQYTIYRYKRTIEEGLVKTDFERTSNKIDVNRIVEFQNRFVKFQTSLEVAVELYLDFWREVSEANPEIQKLQSLGSRITVAVEECADRFKKILSLNANQIKMLQMYGVFLRDIVNDHEGGRLLLDKANFVSKSFKQDQQQLDMLQIKYGENSDTCLITCSGNQVSMGTIIKTNNEITRILDYSKDEVTGNNITQIMPRIIADMHNGFMKKYLTTSEAESMDQEKNVFPVNKKGYLVPCTLMVKVLPNLNYGVQLVGFMNILEQNQRQETNLDDGSPVKHGLTMAPSLEVPEYIMFDTKSGIVHGITHGCKTRYGIPVSLTQGNVTGNDFTVEHIFPQLNKFTLEEISDRSGVVIELDTSLLRQNFQALDEDESDDEAPEAQGSGGLNTDVETGNRSVNVRVTLARNYTLGDVEIRIVKFVESSGMTVMEEEDTVVERSAMKDGEIKSKAQSIQKTLKAEEEEEEEEKNEHGGEEAANKSQPDGHSVSELSSNAFEVNEELKLVKDFKLLISRKSTPKSIILLRNSVILLCIALVILISVALSLRIQQVDTYQSGAQTIINVYQRHNLMSEINFDVRQLELYATGYLQVPAASLATYEANQKAAILTLSNDLSSTSLAIGDYQNSLNGLPNVETSNVVIETQLQDSVKLQTRYFSDSMSQYVSHVTSISSASLASFNATSTQISTVGDFYYIRRNGLGSLRDKSEDNAGVFYNYYQSSVDSYNTKAKIITIVAICVLTLSLMILMSIVFSVHKTATRVLSLFMYIPLSEINELEAHCENYMVTYLLDRKTHKNYSFGEGDEFRDDQPGAKYGDNLYHQVDGEGSVVDGSQGNDDPINLNIEDPIKIPDFDGRSEDRAGSQLGAGRLNQLRVSQNANRQTSANTQLGIGRINSNLRTMKSDSGEFDKTSRVTKDLAKINGNTSPNLKKNHESDNDLNANRSEKFLNSRDEYRRKIMLQFLFIEVIFLAYFLADYFDNYSVLQEIKTCLNHLKLNCERMPNIRFAEDFTIEELAEGSAYPVYNYTYRPYTDLRELYRTRILQNLESLSVNRKQKFSSIFVPYFQYYDAVSNSDLCSIYYNSDTTTITNCQAAGGGLLTEGLIIAITRIVQVSERVILDFNLTQRTTQDQINAINGANIQQSEVLIQYSIPVLQSLLDMYTATFKSFLSRSVMLDKVKFAIFIILIVFVFVVLWHPYKKTLNDKIYKTKGMLKMIPIDVISKDENLKNTFLSGNILQAVR